MSLTEKDKAFELVSRRDAVLAAANEATAQCDKLREDVATLTDANRDLVQVRDNLHKEIEFLCGVTKKDAALHAMLRNYCLPTEPNAFAAQHERLVNGGRKDAP